MVAHEAPRPDAHAGIRCPPSKHGQKGLTVRIVIEKDLSPVPANDHMVHACFRTSPRCICHTHPPPPIRVLIPQRVEKGRGRRMQNSLCPGFAKDRRRHAKIPLSWFCTGLNPSVLVLHWFCMKKAPGGARKSNGGPAGVRTLDLGIKSPLLYQLSYRSTYQETVGWVQGLEPWTSGTTTRRSSQLGYTHRVSSRQSA